MLKIHHLHNDTPASPAKLRRSCLGCSTNTKQGDASLAMKDFIKPARTFALSATSFILSAIAAVLVITALATYTGRSVSSAPKPNAPNPSTLAWNKDAKKTMRAFGSEDELKN